ncbi:MAG: hypothetical protein M3Q52_10000 [Pseudomonadota bacterium]|nr:hypothetical protein [Pseudomonadota bacterium]
MRETSYVIAVIGIIVLIGAAFAWRKVIRGSSTGSTDGDIGVGSRGVRSASIALTVALAICGLAAVVAIVGFFLR